MFKRIGLTIGVILIMIFCVSNASALIAGPARFEVRLPAGERAGISYYAQNDASEPIHVTIAPDNWYQDSYDYQGVKAAEWIKAEPREFDLAPKEIRKVLITIKIPKKAKGELVGQIFFCSAPAGTPDAAAGNIQAKLGVILYAAVKDTEKVNAEIHNIDISNLTVDGKERLSVGVVVGNTGNVHVRPAAGDVLVSDEKGVEVNRLNLPTDASVVPGQEVTYTAQWDKPVLTEGKYKASASLKYGRMYGREKKVNFEKWFEIDKQGKVISK